MARINLEDELTNSNVGALMSNKGAFKRFSVDDLNKFSSDVTNSSSNNIGGFLQKKQQHGHHGQPIYNNLVGDISEFTTNSCDHSVSGVSSNFSTSPVKRFMNPSISQMSGLNNFLSDSRRGSYELNPNILNVVRDMVSGPNYSKSARNSIDFTNIPIPFNFQFNNNVNVLDDKYILDNLLILLKDQNGCRLIQKRIEEKGSDYVVAMFDKMSGSLNEIINDQFGNYVVQKMIDYIYSDKAVVTKFFEVTRGRIYDISVHQFGTRVLQRLMDYFCNNYAKVANPIINDVLKSLIIKRSYDLIMDTNGNHVFQKVLMIYPKKENQFIYDELMKIAIDIAKSKKGGSIFQKALELASPIQKVISPFTLRKL
jgi:hypothetical protein